MYQTNLEKITAMVKQADTAENILGRLGLTAKPKPMSIESLNDLLIRQKKDMRDVNSYFSAKNTMAEQVNNNPSMFEPLLSMGTYPGSTAVGGGIGGLGTVAYNLLTKNKFTPEELINIRTSMPGLFESSPAVAEVRNKSTNKLITKAVPAKLPKIDELLAGSGFGTNTDKIKAILKKIRIEDADAVFNRGQNSWIPTAFASLFKNKGNKVTPGSAYRTISELGKNHKSMSMSDLGNKLLAAAGSKKTFKAPVGWGKFGVGAGVGALINNLPSWWGGDPMTRPTSTTWLPFSGGIHNSSYNAAKREASSILSDLKSRYTPRSSSRTAADVLADLKSRS